MVRVLLLVVVSVIVMTQSLGVLVLHTHIDVVGDSAPHTHSYVADADGHDGHREDAAAAHRSEQPTASLSGVILLLVLAFAAMMRDGRSEDGPRGPVSLRAPRPVRRHPACLALLSVLRV